MKKKEKEKEPIEDPLPSSKRPPPPANRKHVKKVYEGRPDGGPTTRSQTKLIAAGIVNPKLENEIKNECHNLINFINSQKIASPENLIKKRQQKAEARKKLIQRLNSKQLSDLKSSVARETKLWKNNLV